MTQQQFLDHIEAMYKGTEKRSVRATLPNGWMQFDWVADQTIRYTSSSQKKGASHVRKIDDISEYVFMIYLNVYLVREVEFEVLDAQN